MNSKSFTLIEVVIAISVLTLGIGGSFVLIQQTLAAASLSQSKLIAAYLVQEGIEIVRNIRDSNWLQGNSWDDKLINCDPCCEVDYKTTNSITSFAFCDDENLNYLFIEDGFYSYSAFGSQTPFKRKITITERDYLEVKVEVFWKERGRTHNIEAIEHLYNWK